MPTAEIPLVNVNRQTPAKKHLERVTLIEPQNGYYTGFQGLVQTEPLGLEFVAGAVSDMVGDVRIHDDRVNPEGWKDKFRQNPPDMIGIRCNYTADVPTVRKLVGEIRDEVGREVPIIIGGHHISLRPQDVFIPGVNAVVIGPGEIPFQNIVQAWDEQHSLAGVPSIWYQNPDGEFVSNVVPLGISPRFKYDSGMMNERPTPRRDLVEDYLDNYYYLYYPKPRSIETARGCRFRCSFCSVWNFHHGEYNVESPNRTVQEIVGLGDKAKYINIMDDLAFSDIDGAKNMADELIRLKVNKRYWAQIRADNVWPKDRTKRAKHQEAFARLAEAGLDMVLMGLESFDPDELKRVNKGSTVEQNVEAIKFLRNHGVKIWGAQIIFPHWTKEDFDKTIEINQRLGIEAPQFTILTPLPGTPDYEKAVKEGYLTTDNPGDFDFFHWTVPTVLPPEELYRQIARLYRETSPFAKRPDGKFVSMREAVKQYRSIERDIAEGRTTAEAVAEFVKRFAGMQNDQEHLAHLAQSALAAGGSNQRIV